MTRAHPTILLIDHNEKDRTYYAQQLRILIPNCIVLEATDGRSGLALYNSKQIDCLILELELPDQSGFDVLIKVVNQVHRLPVAIVILTRLDSPRLALLARVKRIRAVLVKHSTLGDELAPVIQRAIAENSEGLW